MIVSIKTRTSIDPQYITDSCREAEHKMAVQAERDTRPYVPKRTGNLVNSAVIRGNNITWSSPGVRMLYWNKKMVDPVKKVAGFYNRKYGWFSRPGVTKVYAKAVGVPDKWHFSGTGTDHWFWVSANKNIGRWLAVAEKEIALHGKRDHQ